MCVQLKITQTWTWKICFVRGDFGSFAHLLAMVPFSLSHIRLYEMNIEQVDCVHIVNSYCFFFPIFHSPYFFVFAVHFIILLSSQQWLMATFKQRKNKQAEQSNHLSSVRFVDFPMQLDCL